MAVCVSEIALAIRLRALAVFWGKKLPRIENVALVRIFQVGHVCNLNWLIIWTLFNNSHKVMSTCLVRFGLNVLLRSILQVTLGLIAKPQA